LYLRTVLGVNRDRVLIIFVQHPIIRGMLENVRRAIILTTFVEKRAKVGKYC
jgi:hypothetical protein